MRDALQRRLSRGLGVAVEIAPDVDWLDRLLGRAAVDPGYRELLFTRPALALTGEPLPAGIVAALCQINTRDLSEYARLAIAAAASQGAPTRHDEPIEVARFGDPAVVVAA